MATGTVLRLPPKPYDLDVTIVSAKHLKNVNWRNGGLKPYAILWVDPDRRIATNPSDSGSTKPVWNERFVLPFTFPPRDNATLTLEIFHSNPSEVPKPLVGTLSIDLQDLLTEEPAIRMRTFDIRRPSGRPHGKITLKLGLVERQVDSYHTTPHPGCNYHHYSSAPPPYGGYPHSPYPPPPPLHPYYTPDSPHAGYYKSYYSPYPPHRPFYQRQPDYGGPGPSAPVDYTPYDYPKQGTEKPGVGLEESVKREEDRILERGDNDMVSYLRNDPYWVYRSDH